MQTIREKLSLKFRETIEVDKSQVDLYVKCSVNFEKGTYKVTPVITTQHGTDAAVFNKMRDMALSAATICKHELSEYALESGQGVQGDLFDQPAEHENQVRAAA